MIICTIGLFVASKTKFNVCVMYVFPGVGTQGANKDSWVTLYTLEWSEEGESWEAYQEHGQEKVELSNVSKLICPYF